MVDCQGINQTSVTTEGCSSLTPKQLHLARDTSAL